ncbi:BnaAnng26000D [Brassica napus]|uniref:BnaAnng26000D protein n=1 Tax=Brassica napus TaxID=3708 RepID=A0A078JQU2_BRANA|nr:BnaAnng26000D [Brassica napus]
MANSSLLLPNLKVRCCNSTVKILWVNVSEVLVKKNSKLPKQNTSIMFFTLHSLVVKKDEDVKVLEMVGDEDCLPPPAKVIFTKIISLISKSPLKISAITSLRLMVW